MGFDRSLIALGKSDMYGLPWLAGTGGIQALTKYCKTVDIESVNIPRTCASLQLGLQKFRDDSQSINTVKETTVIPFRVCSNLLYGTLKIYQQQVNNLYKLSEDLIIRSSKYETKAKNNQKSQRTVKKRRLTITHSNDIIQNSSINYSEILEDLERISQESHIEKISSDSCSQIKCSSTQFQIREITIREITTTYGIPELDDDCGFGNATNEDIIDFLNYSGQQKNYRASVAERISLKRKSQCGESENNAKHRRYGDETAEQIIYSGGNFMDTDLILTPSRSKSASNHMGNIFNQNNVCTNNTQISFHSSQCPRRKSGYEEDAVCAKRLKLSHDSTINYKDSTCNLMANDLVATPCRERGTIELHSNILKDIKPEIKDEFDVSYKENLPPGDFHNISHIKNDENDSTDIKKKSFLIIDQCIKLEDKDMIDQINRPIRNLRGVTKMSFKKLQIKRMLQAKELLKRFNKRSLLFAAKLKEKSGDLNKSKFQREYISLLHDILKPYYKEDWAFEIYPKWKQSVKSPRKSKKLHNQKRQDVEKSTPIPMQIDDNCNVLYNDNLHVVQDGNPEKISFKDNAFNMSANAEEMPQSNNWRPYYVMIRLLYMWQTSGPEIDANKFCQSPRNRIDKALAFSSLLVLSKSRFVVITQRYKSIEMDKIVLGKAAKNILEKK
ncbi:uncharacterized protein LOC105261847 isoform X2 [Musca domestica]|uniref:Uncharacterized protein LOC105261847 isoform X2 n=1 Tax=Musca domestica TaxID=7370 RepID=A0A9J7DHW5_MUSDO|nr:uncharacterized protein LOC105261847 isoform X2 [Musca domestica]